MIATAGAVTSLTLKKIEILLFVFLDVSLAMYVTLYWPFIKVFVKVRLRIQQI